MCKMWKLYFSIKTCFFEGTIRKIKGQPKPWGMYLQIFYKSSLPKVKYSSLSSQYSDDSLIKKKKWAKHTQTHHTIRYTNDHKIFMKKWSIFLALN